MSYIVRLGSARCSKLINLNRTFEFSASSASSGYRLCPFCMSKCAPFVLRPVKNSGSCAIYHTDIRKSSLSTYSKLSENLPVKGKARRKWKIQKFVELIEVGDKTSSEAIERSARIKKSSATNTLKKLGVPTSDQKVKDEAVILNSVDTKSDEAVINRDYFSELDVETKLVDSDAEAFAYTNASDLSSSFDALAPAETTNSEFLIGYEHNVMNSEKQISEALKVSDAEEELAESKSKSKKEKRKAAKIKKVQLSEEELKHNRREFIHNQTQKNLLPFIDACVNSNMMDLANNSLLNNHKRCLGSEFQTSDIRLYNCVLEGWAARGNCNKFDRIFALIRQPNLQSYVYAIECAYRGNRHGLIKNILDKIQSKGFLIENILRECKFVNDQKDIVLKAIRAVLPGFEPLKPEKPQGYLCNLLKSLNGDNVPKLSYSPLGSGLSVGKLQELAKRQLDIETKGQLNIRSIEKKPTVSKKTLAWRQKLEKSEKIWKQLLTTQFKMQLDNLQRESTYKRNRSTDLLPYLKVLDSEVFIDFMFQEVGYLALLSEGFSPMILSLYMSLGNKIMDRYFLHKKKANGMFEKVEDLYNRYCEYFTDPTLTSKYTPRQYWEFLQAKYCDGLDIEQRNKQWPPHVVIGVGEFLYNIIIQNIKVDINLFNYNSDKPKLIPAFYVVYRNHGGAKIRRELKPHPQLSRLYTLANRDDLLFESSVLPMLCPPLPWTSVHSGGFLLSSAKIVRLPNAASHQRLRLDEMNLQKLYPSFDSLNQLGECPWIINKPLLDLVIEVFNNKGSVELDIPRPISVCPPLPKIKGHLSQQEFKKLKREKENMQQRKAEMYSLWCDMLYKLSIANQFRDEILWLPHNMDFRGRVYPCPPHFNHLGSDVSRSLLLFAKGEPLGEEGLKWLKMHLINLTGLKKRSALEDRLDYCDSILENILDSADNPLTGKGWWKKSDEPWQTLACCMELAKALRSPHPHAYICHFPVHQDGSCNGLQHYAALGRDKHGAEQVNLEPSDVPQDVYSGVAELVEIERRKDALVGHKTAQILEGFISRRVVKQPVMTTVYGVTKFGARLQVIRQLEDLNGFPPENMNQAASYLVEKIFLSLATMFSATKEIQEWFTNSARDISQICEQPVEWETPIGLPIIQPYFKDRRLSHTANSPNTKKQKNAFPPNYIHSLDSTHMMLTSLFCQRQGIVFVSVHDCFWTHPSTVDKMNRICREQFVALHSEPLLESLSEYLTRKFILNTDNTEHSLRLNRTLAAVPEKGSFDLNRVLESTYFFS